jgi:trigger factor
MQLQVADAGPLRKKLTISYSPAEVQARRAQVLRQLSGEVKLNGFRPGKGSTAVVEKRYGAAATARAKELLADEALNQAVKDNQLKPIGPIENDAAPAEGKDDQGFELVLSFEVKPPIQLPEPKSLGIAEEPVELPESEVEKAVESLCKRAGALEPLAAGETIAEDDSISLEGKVMANGAEVRDLKDFHHLVGGYPLFGATPKDVIAAFAGKKAGDTVAIETTLPKTFTPAEHAEKPARLELTVKGAQRLRAAKADDDFAKRMGVESLDKLRELMRARLKGAKEQEVRQKQVKQLVETLVEKVQVEPPPKLLEASLKQSVEAALKRAESEGKTGADLEKAKADAEADVRKGVRRYLILDAIIESRRVAVTREDLEDQIRMAAGQTGRKPEDIAKQLKESGQINQVVQEIREAKAIEIFLDEALGRPVAPANPAHGEIGHVHGPDCNH